jgi:methyl-accepting chemotaxis protein
MMTHRSKVIGLAVLSVLLPVIVFFALTVQFEKVVSLKATEDLDQLATVNVGQIARDVYGICQVSYDLLQQKINHDLVVAREALEKKGKVRTGTGVLRWEATNQFTGKTETIVLPRFVAGGTWLPKNVNPDTPTPIVDDVKRLVGGTCTIFQRMNARGDMIRLASNIVGTNGKRMIGTYIPAENPDGAPNPIVRNILQGQSSRCLAYLMNSWYLTAYEPLRNKKDDIVGMICVGEKLEGVASLRKTIANMQVGRQGEVGVIGTQGKYQGRYIISKESAKDGMDIWNTKDTTGRYYVQSMVRKALDQPREKVTYEHFSLLAPGDKRPQKKIAAVAYFEPYDWLIFASTSDIDSSSSLHWVNDSIRKLLLEMVVVAACFLILAVIGGVFLGREMTTLLQFMTRLAKNMAAGDLQKVRQDLATEFGKRDEKSKGKSRKGEMEILLGAFSVMTERLDFSFRRLRRLAAPVSNPVAVKVPTGPAVSETATTPVSDNPQGTPIVEEMVREIGKVRLHLNQTIDEAQSSRKELAEIESSMRGLSEATDRLSSRLTAIGDQAHLLLRGANTMTEIADQTNLLSLNVSIEAEKAGESVKGMSVFARGVNHLTNRTEMAAQDIGEVTKELQTAVSDSFIEADNLGDDVKKNVERLFIIRDRLGMVIDHLQAYDFQLDSIKKGFDEQSVEGKRLGDAVSHLSAASIRTKESLLQFREAIDRLNLALGNSPGDLSEKGLSVVAREVTRMAGQTVNAVQNIDEVLQELQLHSATGSMEKEKIADEVRSGMAKMIKISEQLCMIIDHLQAYDHQLDVTEKGLDNKGSEAELINDALTNLSAVTTRTRESLQEFKKATENLKHLLGSFPEGTSQTGNIPD